MNNFDNALLQAKGTVLDKVEVAPDSGIYQVRYQLPGGTEKTKTVYDPAKFSDTQMANMASEAAGRAAIEYQRTGIDRQVVNVNGVDFFVPIRVPKNPAGRPFSPNNPAQPYVPTAYPHSTQGASR